MLLYLKNLTLSWLGTLDFVMMMLLSQHFGNIAEEVAKLLKMLADICVWAIHGMFALVACMLLTITGHNQLGGYEMDRLIFLGIVDKIAAATGINFGDPKNAKRKDLLQRACKAAKEAILRHDTVSDSANILLG